MNSTSKGNHLATKHHLEITLTRHSKGHLGTKDHSNITLTWHLIDHLEIKDHLATRGTQKPNITQQELGT